MSIADESTAAGNGLPAGKRLPWIGDCGEIVMNRPDGPSRDEGKLSGKDITPVLKGWDYEPGTINVRKINGVDGSAKLQMRVDLGLLQMEMSGRPDGVRPHGCESLLDYFERELNE
jgi:hypothetical protein